MTQDEAVREVAAHLAGLLQAGTFEESTGHDEADLSEADEERLGRAVQIVTDRLYRMGKGGRSR